MKEFISIPTLPSDRVPPAMIDELVAIDPAGERIGRDATGQQTRSFCFTNIPRDDPRVDKVFAVLRKYGWFPHIDETLPMQPNEYFLILERKYTRSDLRKCELLKFTGRRYVPDLGWRTKPEGLIVLPVHRMRKIAATDADTLYTYRPGWDVVSDRVKRIIEEAGMRHVVFRPTVLVRGKGMPDDPPASWSKVGDPWWEITSDYTLPPLSPTVQIVAQDGSPFVSYKTQNLELREGLYRIPELHYRRADIERCEPFDLALSYEHIGKPPYQQMKIASQRLYQLFTKYSIKAAWMPVRLDE